MRTMYEMYTHLIFRLRERDAGSFEDLLNFNIVTRFFHILLLITL